MRRQAPAVVFALLVAACAGGTGADTATTTTATTQAPMPDSAFPPAPPSPAGPLAAEAAAALDRAWAALPRPDPSDLEAIGASGDIRLAWLLTDFLRFAFADPWVEAATGALEDLTGLDLAPTAPWVTATDHLIAWDIPAPPGYVAYKAAVFVDADERWAPFFTEQSDIDYRWLSWGGVFIDDRPPGDASRCLGCIPALDDPVVTGVEDGDWYPDDRYVFGVSIGGQARAYPRNVMEVHEMVNDSLGGRRFALPYCTLCGTAVLYFTDDLPAGISPPTLRTSGLLSRSNKVMYDVVSGSVFDQFTGRAVAGPLWEADIRLTQGTVVTTTWAAWKAAHPDTTIVSADARGVPYPLEPLGGRDDRGPIFPIGERDPRLDVHEQVVGVILDDGTPVAFPAAEALAALTAGEPVTLAGAVVVEEAGGLRVEDAAGAPIASAQSFWFAWSQFHPETLLWER